MSPGFDNVISAKVRVDAETVAAPHVLPLPCTSPQWYDTVPQPHYPCPVLNIP